MNSDLNLRRISSRNRHPVHSDDSSTPQRISDHHDWLNWNGDLYNQNGSEDDCAADIESEMEQDKRIEQLDSPEQRNLRAKQNVPGMFRPVPKSTSSVKGCR
jgi:hypothetical protein